MKISVESIINQIITNCQCVYGYDLSFLIKANTYDDLHYLYKGVVKFDSKHKIETFGLQKIISEIEIKDIDLCFNRRMWFGFTKEYYGLFSNVLNQSVYWFVNRLFSEFDSVTLKEIHISDISITDIEFHSALNYLNCIISCFECMKLYNIAFFQYMFYILSNPKEYDWNCLKNISLISFSETPSVIQAIENIEIGTVSDIYGLKIVGKDILLSHFFSEIINLFLGEEYAKHHFVDRNSVSLLYNIVKILKCFELDI